MKKEYIKPDMKVYYTSTPRLLAASGVETIDDFIFNGNGAPGDDNESMI
ncbi:MAG: hypothetical protein ACI4B3_01235 [Prevotella sp.]